MPNKPKPRILGAEPLEERLPVSGSIAGVLLGYGLSQKEPGAERSATPGYEASQTIPSSSLAQQTALIDLTLDLQLDAIAADQVHSEESLDALFSSALDDPFTLTPLAPAIALSDAEVDARRKLGDEILLYQISTLDFVQVSFEPMTPERFEPVIPQQKLTELTFDDALTPPDDLTAYGYSPVANDLKEKNDTNGGPQMSCGCGSGSCSCGSTPYVYSACLSGTACGGAGCGASPFLSWAAVARNPAGGGGYIYSPSTYHPSTNPVLIFQDGDTATVYVYVSWVGTGTGSINVYSEEAEYWSITSSTSGSTYLSQIWTWTKPTNKSNSEVLRDFEFTFSVSGGNSVALSIHLCYAEIKTVNFVDHDVLQSNWKQENDEWVKDNTFTFTGTDLSPNWDVDRKDSGGNYVSVGASYTKSTYAKVEATFEMDFGGQNLSYQVKGTGTNMWFISGTLNGATSSKITMISTIPLPNSINKFTTDLTWSIIVGGTTLNAGTSGSHTIYTTLDTPIQSYVVTPVGGLPVFVDNTTTEKRLDWAVGITKGATTRTGGTVAAPTTGAAEKMVAVIGHKTPRPHTSNWDAWTYLQHRENGGNVGDCGTVTALAVAGLGQVGVPANHELAYPASNSPNPIGANSCKVQETKTVVANGYTVKARLVFPLYPFDLNDLSTDNKNDYFEAFFTVEDAGVTKAYTVYPKNGPIVANSTGNLHYTVLRTVGVNRVFWALDVALPVPGVGIYSVGYPLHNIPELGISWFTNEYIYL